MSIEFRKYNHLMNYLEIFPENRFFSDFMLTRNVPINRHSILKLTRLSLQQYIQIIYIDLLTIFTVLL
jgi:hypothetical protein